MTIVGEGVLEEELERAEIGEPVESLPELFLRSCKLTTEISLLVL